MPAALDQPMSESPPKRSGVKDSTSKSVTAWARSTMAPSPPTWLTANTATRNAPRTPRKNWKKSVATTPHRPATPAYARTRTETSTTLQSLPSAPSSMPRLGSTPRASTTFTMASMA